MAEGVLDILVDMKKLATHPPIIEPLTWCAPVVATAIRALQLQWGPYSDAGGKKRIGQLLLEIIEPAWRDYISTLSCPMAARLLGSFEFRRPTGRQGLTQLHTDLLELIRSYSMFSFDSTLSDSEVGILDDTLNSLDEMLLQCSLKRPMARTAGDSSRRRNGWIAICYQCGRQTELQAALRKQKDGSKKGKSGLYCQEHRPKNRTGGWNAAYKRAGRQHESFKKECASIARGFVGSAAGEELDRLSAREAFNRRIAIAADTYDRRSSKLRNLARALVDLKITNKKKELAVMLELGLNQAEIAKRFNVSRQAVSKMVNSPDFQKILSIYTFPQRINY